MNKERYKTVSYAISTVPEFLDKQNAMEPALRDKIEGLYFEVMEQNGGRKSIKKLRKLIEEFPENPQLKNFLLVAYDNAGNKAKSREVNHWILAEHPDYLFGKLNQAAEYYEEEEYEKMLEVLGEEMEIQSLYPERNEFHVAEVTGFYKFAVLYFAAIGNLETAGGRLEIMQDIAPDHPDTRFAELIIMEAGMKKNLAIWEEDEKTKIHVTPASNTLPPQKSEVPAIVNPLVIHLYENGLYIDDHLIHEILKLPRKSLIADLELILDDLLCRYEFFKHEVENLGWDEEEMGFPIHAIMLLAELRAEESLPKVLEVLSQDDEFLHFWFEDHLTTTLWEPLYYLGNKQLDVLKQFVQEAGIETFAKTAVSRAVSQIHYHQSEKKEEVFQWFSEVLEFFTNSQPEDNVIDSDTIGLILCDVVDLRYEALLPLIKDLYSKHYVAEGITGDYKSVEKDIKKAREYPNKENLMDIISRYENITTAWSGYKEEDANTDFDDYVDYDDIPETEPVRTGPKIGRNDPCPCGSGKKYKKCCFTF